MPMYAHISEANQANQRLTCKVKGCTQPRYRISGYCRNHNRINNMHGSPYHRKLNSQHYAMEFAGCLGLICRNFNEDHPGVLYGLKFFQQWLSDAAAGKPGTPCLKHFRGLSDAGIDPIDLLAISAALVLFQHRYPERIRDGRHLIYCIGSRILRTVPYHGVPRGALFREVGEHVWGNLKTLLSNITGTIERKEQEKDENLKAMYRPLAL